MGKAYGESQGVQWCRSFFFLMRRRPPRSTLFPYRRSSDLMINAWKKQAMEGMSGFFSGKAEAAEASREAEIDRLHAKIGQLVVERDFLAKASGR